MLRKIKSKPQTLLTTLTIIFILINIDVSTAATHYVYQNAIGKNNGTNWNDAFTKLPDTLFRGDTYYIADGTYGSYNFNTPSSGSSYIFIKKATASDHGSSTGWSGDYGDGRAVWRSWNFSSDYWDINGAVGLWAQDIPGYVPYGIVLENTSGKLMNFANSSIDYVNITHVEASFTNTPKTGSWTTGMHIIYGYGSNWTFSKCWFHDAGSVIMLAVGADDVTIEYSVLERNGQEAVAMGTSTHSEIVMLQPDADRATFRYNYIRDWRSTGGIVLYDRNDDIKFYGNVFQDTGYWAVPGEANDSNGVITGLSHDAPGSAYVYNNTFVNLRYGARVLGIGAFTGPRITQNNLFYNCTLYARGNNPGLTIGGVHDYNWFYNSGQQNETNMEIGHQNPFLNDKLNDFRLLAPTLHGNNLLSEYSFDLYNSPRGADGNWDKGAFEYAAANSNAAPNPPFNLTVSQ